MGRCGTMSASVLEVELPMPERRVELAGYVPARLWDGAGGGLLASFLLWESAAGQKMAFGSIDLLFVDAAFEQDLLQRVESFYSVTLCATHTHSAPNAAQSVESLGAVDEGWRDRVLDTLAKALSENTVRGVAHFSYSRSKTTLNINRRARKFVINYRALAQGNLDFGRKTVLAPNPEGEVDSNVYSIIFKDPEGKVVGCLWSLSAHPTTAAQGGSSKRISPDFPGEVRNVIKSKFGSSCVAIFLPGFAGSAIVNCARKSTHDEPLGKKIRKCLPFSGLSRPFDPGALKNWIYALGEIVVTPDKQDIILEESKVEPQIILSKTKPVFFDEKRGGLELSIAKLSLGAGLVIYLSNGEMLAEWQGLFATTGGLDSKCIRSGYASGHCLYIPPRHEFEKGGYEVDGFKSLFGLDGEFAEDIDQIVTDAFAQ